MRSLAIMFGKVRRNLLVFGIAVLIGALAGVLYAITSPPRYKAVITFALEDESTGSGRSGLLGLATQFGFDFSSGGAGIFTRDNIQELILSRRIIQGALLSPVPYKPGASFATELTGILRLGSGQYVFPVNGGERSRTQDSILNQLYKVISKKLVEVRPPDKKRNVFTVICITEDEQFSKAFLEELITETSNFYIETKVKRARQHVETLQRRADSLRQAFYSSAYKRAAVADANINAAFQRPQVNTMISQSEMSLSAAAYSELVKNLEVAKYTLLRQTPLVQVIDTPGSPLEKQKKIALIYGIAGAFLGAFLVMLALALSVVFKNLKAQNFEPHGN